MKIHGGEEDKEIKIEMIRSNDIRLGLKLFR